METRSFNDKKSLQLEPVYNVDWMNCSAFSGKLPIRSRCLSIQFQDTETNMCTFQNLILLL